jgi:hypothetical protein
MSGNGFSGVGIFGTAQAFIGHSVSTGNTSGPVENDTSPNSFFSYKNNQFDQAIGTTLNTTLGLQ